MTIRRHQHTHQLILIMGKTADNRRMANNCPIAIISASPGPPTSSSLSVWWQKQQELTAVFFSIFNVTQYNLPFKCLLNFVT